MIIQITNIVDPDTRGSGYTWIRIQFAGSGSRREKISIKVKKFQVLKGGSSLLRDEDFSCGLNGLEDK
jgi:hypothetical protein